MRFLWIAVFLGSAFGAGTNPREIVRKAVLNDRTGSAGIAQLYAFTESSRNENLDDQGRARSVTSRTREMRMAEFLRRRERFQRSVQEIPDAFDFRLVGEEMIRSRPVYLIEALPHPGYQPVDRYSKLFTQVKARLWIDKADFRWARIEAELLDTMSFGWILLRIHSGSRVALTQMRQADGAWLPERTWYRVSVRVGLVKFSRVESETLYSRYVLAEAPEDPQTGRITENPSENSVRR
jgi:hypothetical protein